MGEVSRRYPQRPMVGVGGIVFRENKVLLVKRGRSPAKGQWSIPGGPVEVGELLAAAVAREIHEETGVRVEPGPLVEVFEPLERDDGGEVVFHYVVLDYLCRYLEGEPSAASDAAETRWVGPEEEEGLRIREITRRVIAKARRMAQG